MYYTEIYKQLYLTYKTAYYTAYKQVKDNKCGFFCGCGGWFFSDCYKTVAYTESYKKKYTNYRTATRTKSKQVKETTSGMFKKCEITSDTSNRFYMKGWFPCYNVVVFKTCYFT